MIHDDLNARAEAILRAEPFSFDDSDLRNSDYSSEIIEVLRNVAAAAGYVAVKDNGTCELWKHRESRHTVNLWIENVTGVGLEDGGLGFDDQTEWVDEEAGQDDETSGRYRSLDHVRANG